MISSWLLADVVNARKTTRYNLPDVELSEDWKSFEDVLGKFKQEYVTTLAQLKIQEEAIIKLKNDVTLLTESLNAVRNRDFYDDIKVSIEKFKSRNDYDKKNDEFLNLAGKVKAMENVLTATNAKRYNKFTCSICMDSLVDTFLDPCGHLICKTCLVRSLATQCPMCRTPIVPKKIYSTM
jgi:hypothetical protein